MNGQKYDFQIIGFTCDIPNRTFLKFTKAHTAFFSCERCETRGKSFKQNKNSKSKKKGTKRIFPKTECLHRTRKKFVIKDQLNHHIPNSTSALLQIPGLNIIKDVFIESVHLIDIETLKRIITTWLSDKKNQLGKLNEDKVLQLDFIMSHYVKNSIPREFHRKHYNIHKPGKWKANQNRMFMLYVAVFIMKDLLDIDAYNHLLLYIIAYRLLSDPDMCTENAGVSRSYFTEFFKDIPQIYGKENQVLNMHYLIHVADDVQYTELNLIKISAYDFENYLGILGNLINGPSDPLTQVINRLFEIQNNKSAFIKLKRRLCDITFDEKDNSLEQGIIIKSVYFKGYIIQSETPDNLIALYDGIYLKVNKIFAVNKNIESSDDITISGFIQNSISIFEYPCNSKDIGLVKIISTNIKYSCLLSNVYRKCFSLTLENETFSATMLHEE